MKADLVERGSLRVLLVQPFGGSLELELNQVMASNQLKVLSMVFCWVVWAQVKSVKLIRVLLPDCWQRQGAGLLLEAVEFDQMKSGLGSKWVGHLL